MGKITGTETIDNVPEKVLAIYEAVMRLMAKQSDPSSIKVSTITEEAGIGKGTAYEYFDTKEDILACAMTFYTRKYIDEIKESINSKATFREKIDDLFDQIDYQAERKKCIVSYFHLMTGNSELSRKMQLLILNGERHKGMWMEIFEDIISDGIKSGELRSDMPGAYMVISIFSRALTYIISTEPEIQKLPQMDASNVRRLAKISILNELSIDKGSCDMIT